MQFRLPASLGDEKTFPQHLIQALGTFALMHKNRLDFILLIPSTITGEGGLSTILNSLDWVQHFKLDT